MKKIFWVIIIALLVVANVYIYQLKTEREAGFEKNETLDSSLGSVGNTLDRLEDNYIIIFVATIVILILIFLLLLIKKNFS